MGLLLVFCACNKPVFEHYEKVKDANWSQKDAYTFDVEIPEAGRYALFINLKYNENYAWSNLWLRADLQPPKGEKISQRFNIPLFNPEGEPLQDALGATYFRKFPAQRLEQKLLPFDAEQAGNYKFTLHQEMRSTDLQGIEKIGLQLKRMD